MRLNKNYGMSSFIESDKILFSEYKQNENSFILRRDDDNNISISNTPKFKYSHMAMGYLKDSQQVNFQQFINDLFKNSLFKLSEQKEFKDYWTIIYEPKEYLKYFIKIQKEKSPWAKFIGCDDIRWQLRYLERTKEILLEVCGFEVGGSYCTDWAEHFPPKYKKELEALHSGYTMTYQGRNSCKLGFISSEYGFGADSYYYSVRRKHDQIL